MIKTLKVFFKFGIVVFVVISAVAGYGIGFQVEDSFSFIHFFSMMLGTFLISSGSLSLNQVQESDRDAKMPRTQGRPIPSGVFTRKQGLMISLGNIIVGSVVLFFVNPLSCYIGLVIIALYNVFYTMHWKQKWKFAAVPGAIPGALPCTLGYAAVNPDIFSSESVYLFLVMFLWQMPHFWTLAIRYKDDYAAADFPILPVVIGKDRTIFHISFYVWAYAFLALMSPFFVDFGYAYFAMVIPFAVIVVWLFFKYVKNESKSELAWLPFFLATNFSMLAFLFAPLIDKWTPLIINT
jgi:protoheme IX farnesyltransferase